MIRQLLEGVAALALMTAVSACGNGMNIHIGDDDGVPLSDLDMSGEAPTKLMLASKDKVVITEGSKLAIEVDGDPAAADVLRFNLEDGTLGISRERDSNVDGIAVVSVTMPAAREFTLAGSGRIDAPSLVDKAQINILGSGGVGIAKVAASKLSVNMMGSGTLTAAGAAERLDFNIAGSGKLAARPLKVERAEINIAGSGSGEFSSDGTVKANVAGSGEVTVYGRADCKISALGSGKLHCRDADATASAGASAPPVAPLPPPPPDPPAGGASISPR